MNKKSHIPELPFVPELTQHSMPWKWTQKASHGFRTWLAESLAGAKDGQKLENPNPNSNRLAVSIQDSCLRVQLGQKEQVYAKGTSRFVKYYNF